MKKKDLTLARIKNTSFPKIYERLLLNKDILPSDYVKALSIATICLNSNVESIRRLGYRIILIYCNQTHDYKPLYEVALNIGFIPVSKLIESFEEYISYESFFTEINASFSELFRENTIYKSEQQQELNDFYSANNDNTVSIIAPTSYGKTDLILFTLSNNSNRNICVITPTKSLLAQTKMRIMNAKISWIHKVVTHPEMYNELENNIVAVLTQERLLRLLKMHPTLSFDYVIVDEAHSLLNNDERNRLLASVIIILEKRNSETVFKFLTPFLCDSDNIHIRFTDIQMSSYSVSEYIKTEKLYIYDERKTKQLFLYDQFVDDFFVVNQLNANDFEFIIDNSANKNIIYFNKPKDIESFTLRLAQKLPIVDSDIINVACKNLKEFIHPQYDLMDCLKKGMIYHHGSVPDSIRIYIEYLFSTLPEIKYVTTSSTLLEGVNLPADRMFILDNKKGRNNLSPSSFKNLIGRICRFNEIFKKGASDLQKLEPKIFLVVGDYYSKNANAKKFLSHCMKIDKKLSDEIENVLLSNKELDGKDIKQLDTAVEFIENYESGTIDDYQNRRVKTQIGKSCFLNNITELDIFKMESKMQGQINEYLSQKLVIDNTQLLFDVMYSLFFINIVDDDNNQNLIRFKYVETRNFYKMFLNWRIKSASYSEMVASFIKHWKSLSIGGKQTIVYVGRWGDTAWQGVRELWTDISKKTDKQKINLAIVRIKDEQDFLDNTIIKFIEVLNDLSLLEGSLYLKIKYGTDDKQKVLLIKNGLSLSLANLLIDDYWEYLKIDIANNTVEYNPKIIDEMEKNDENQVLIYETRYFISK